MITAEAFICYFQVNSAGTAEVHNCFRRHARLFAKETGVRFAAIVSAERDGDYRWASIDLLVGEDTEQLGSFVVWPVQENLM